MTEQSALICAPVPLEHLAQVWDDAAPHLQRAEKTAYGRMSLADLNQSLLAGSHLLWVVYDPALRSIIAAFTTRIICYPQLRAMVVEWMGGARMREWIALAHEKIKLHAAENTCTQLEAEGRNAWVRWATRVGWEPEYVKYKMEI